MSLGLITAVVNGALSLGDKMIADEDKRVEYAFKTQEITFKLLENIVNMRTIPLVDAFTKLMVASVALARPIGTFALTCAGIYMHIKGVSIPELVHAGMDSAFGVWVGAREVDKSRKHKEKIAKRAFDEEEW